MRESIMSLAVVATRKLSVVIIEEHDFDFATQLGTTCHLEVGLMSVLDNRIELWMRGKSTCTVPS